MILLELLKPVMTKERFRCIDFARELNKKPQSISYLMHRQVDYIKIKDLRQLLSLMGLDLKIDFEKRP